MQSISVTTTTGTLAYPEYANLLDINMIAASDMVVTLYDGTSTAGKKVMVIKTLAGIEEVEHLTSPYTFMYGIFAVVSGTGNEVILHLE